MSESFILDSPENLIIEDERHWHGKSHRSVDSKVDDKDHKHEVGLLVLYEKHENTAGGHEISA